MRYTEVDVFTNRLLYGNPVAVVHDADDLSDETMAAFARWTNLSETTFLLQAIDPRADYRLRIFTPNGELPFAGHPTLGSARAFLDRESRSDDLVQECGAGLVTVKHHGARLAFAAPALCRSGPADPATRLAAATALGLPPDHLLAVEWLDNGPGWLGVLLHSADEVLALPTPAASELRLGVVGPHEAGGPAQVEVRAFVAGLGIPEDPVTGSLAAGLGQWLPTTGLVSEAFTIRQGTVLGRCGMIYISRHDGQVWVAGDTVIGVRGEACLG